MKKFNDFDELAFDTKQKLLSFCDYAPKTLSRYDSIVEMLKEVMVGTEMVFSLSRAQKWLDCFIVFNNYSDYTYKKYRRIILLLDNNYVGELNYWKIFPSVHRLMPKLEGFLRTASHYEDYLKSCEYAEKTIYIRMSFAYGFLYYLESVGFDDVKPVTAFTVSDYISSAHFKNRAPNGVSTEIIGIRQFLRFLEDRHFIKTGIHHACFSRQDKSRRIVSTYTDRQVEVLCSEYQALQTNLRNRAAYLLALKCGLRTCDIMNLKFENINFKKKTICLVQNKTKEVLVIPFDKEVSNALIRYILEERRECSSNYVFVTVTGPVRKLTHHSSLRTETRFRKIAECDKPVHDGLHILRRTFASELLKSGISVALIASALGHADTGTVDRYLAVEEEKMRKCALPVDEISYEGGLY